MPPELRYSAGDARCKKNNEGEAGMEDPSQLFMGAFPLGLSIGATVAEP